MSTALIRVCALVVCLAYQSAAYPQAGDEASGAGGPWGIASSAEWSGEYPRFNPIIRDAGVRWLRLFPEWQTIQPAPDRWNWRPADDIVADARKNGLRVLGVWAYFAPFASADGGTRRGPIRDMRFWRDYVEATARRYQKDIRHWEVWNEFNGSFYEGRTRAQKAADYAALVREAHAAVRRVDEGIGIGMSVANFDVGFLEAAIREGAAGHFDFICVHPYENIGALADGGEAAFLSLAPSLRNMLSANAQRADIPLWITEIGEQAPVKADPAGDARQAELLVKTHILSLAQGFERVFWFEARGPSYGKDTDFGIIRRDWTLRPAHQAMKTMTAALGDSPRYCGWLDVGKGGCGFVFDGAAGPVLAAWSSGGERRATFAADVTVTDLGGARSPLPAGKELTLAARPVFVTGIPAEMAAQARANRDRPVPWGGDWARATVVSCRLGAANIDGGVKQINPHTTVVVNIGNESCRRTDFANPLLRGEGRYVYFRVDPLFVPYGTKELQITVAARRADRQTPAGMNLCYESAAGYRNAGVWWTVPEDDDRWHEHTWRIGDANFVGQWGWNFRLDAIGSKGEFLVREVRVTKEAPRK